MASKYYNRGEASSKQTPYSSSPPTFQIQAPNFPESLEFYDYSSRGSVCNDFVVTEESNFSNNNHTPEDLAKNLISNPEVNDLLKAKIGSYWTTFNQNVNFVRNTYNGSSPIVLTFSGSQKTDEGTFFTLREAFLIEAKADRFKMGKAAGNQTVDFRYDKNLFNVFINGGEYKNKNYQALINTEGEFIDHTCVVSSLYSKKQAEMLNDVGVVCYAEISDYYRIYLEDYETFISNDDVHESTIPNLYSYYLSKLNTVDQSHYDSISLNDNLENIPEKPSSDYFDKFAENYYSSGDLEEIKQKFSKIVVPYTDVKKNLVYNEKSEDFPMHIELSFKTDTRTAFAEILKESKLSTLFMKYVVKYFSEGDEKGNIDILNVLENRRTPKTNVIRRFNLERFMNYLSSGNYTLDFQHPLYLGTNEVEPAFENPDDFSIMLSIFGTVLREKVRNLVEQNYRSFKEIIGGKPAYSETVFYKVVKYNSDGEILQEIYLPNSNEIDFHNYVDTQVKYGKTYTYKIFGYEMVIGSSYSYEEINTSDSFAVGVVNHKPSVQVLEIEIFSKSTAVLDSPPMAPEIELIPFKGVNDKIRCFINNSVGKITAQPITLNNQESTKVNAYKILKEIEPSEPILFKSDDIPKRFEIFRLDKRPETYQDFAGNKIAMINTNISREEQVSSVAFDDSIAPNQKYYYMFRSIDVHNNISLPTEVYELEIIDDNGTVYPIVRAIQMEKEDNNTPTKSFKRFLKIKPSTANLFFNDEELNGLERAPDLVSLGLNEEKAWDKDFKIRITSKQTGKKIDINFKFVNKKE